MSEDDNSLIAIEDSTRTFVKFENPTDDNRYKTKKNQSKKDEGEIKSEKKKASLLRRLPSFQSALRPNLTRLRNSFRSLSCVKSAGDDEVRMVEVGRHRSIDINVGLARRVSTFLFTKRTVSMHPYHPYTPEQTTRKLYFGLDDKYS